MGATPLTFRWADSAELLDGALAVREQVFCREQGVPLAEEHDGRDEEADHLVALAPDGRVVATLRVLLVDGTAKVGRVAVERDWRRRGIALRMLELALELARDRGCERVGLAAQVDACELYRRVGFNVESEPFEEAGIEHVWMGRTLAAGGRDAPA